MPNEPLIKAEVVEGPKVTRVKVTEVPETVEAHVTEEPSTTKASTIRPIITQAWRMTQ